MRTFICIVVFGILNELDYMNILHLNILWVFLMAFGTVICIFTDIMQLRLLVKTMNQLEEATNKLKEL